MENILCDLFKDIVNAVVSRHQYSALLITYSLWELEGETRIS